MTFGEVSLRDAATLRDYVLLPQGEEPFGWGAHDAVDTRAAISMLVAVISARLEHPHWELLHALSIVEHPYNLDPSALEVMVASGLARGLGLRLLCRRDEYQRPSSKAHRQASTVSAPAAENLTSFVGVELFDQDGVPIRGLLLELTLPDGSVRVVVSAVDGRMTASGIAPGTCKIATAVG